MSAFASETASDFEEAVQRATFRHPFLTDYSFETKEEGIYAIQFALVRPIDDLLLREIGEDLYESLRQRGYLVNVNLTNQTEEVLQFKLNYSGIQIK